MRGYSHARISRRYPEALGVCDRCGRTTNHVKLNWQYDWVGPKIQNLRQLVCQTCLDTPFEPNRTIIIPPDPSPILNPRIEQYFLDNSPVSPLGWDALRLSGQPGVAKFNGNIGNMVNRGGIDAPFFGSLNKPKAYSAVLSPSSSGANYVGKNWTQFGYPITSVPGTLTPPGTTYALASVILQAPTDAAFLDTGPANIEIDGWNGSGWVSITTAVSSGSKGETLTLQLSGSQQFYGHRVVITGDGVSDASIASAQFFAAADAVYSSAPNVQPS